MWERACPRRRCVSYRKYRLNQSFRGQARSHSGEWVVHAYGARPGDFNRATTPRAPHRSKMWERACPRRRCISHRRYRLNQRFREQARSHRGEWVVHAYGARPGDFNRTTTPEASHRSKMWERACPRRRCVSYRKYRLNQRFREQARSHSGECGVHAGRARPGDIPGTSHIDRVRHAPAVDSVGHDHRRKGAEQGNGGYC